MNKNVIMRWESVLQDGNLLRREKNNRKYLIFLYNDDLLFTYNVHKLLIGLVDMYKFTDNKLALKVADNLAINNVTRAYPSMPSFGKHVFTISLNEKT